MAAPATFRSEMKEYISYMQTELKDIRTSFSDLESVSERIRDFSAGIYHIIEKHHENIHSFKGLDSLIVRISAVKIASPMDCLRAIIEIQNCVGRIELESPLEILVTHSRPFLKIEEESHQLIDEHSLDSEERSLKTDKKNIDPLAEESDSEEEFTAANDEVIPPNDEFLSSIELSEEERARMLSLPFFDKNELVVAQTGEVEDGTRRISEKEIIISGPVLEDGLGDFFNIKAIIDEILSKYPEQKITVVIHMLKAHYEGNKHLFNFPPQVTTCYLLRPRLPTDDEKAFMFFLIREKQQRLILPPELVEKYRTSAYNIEYHTTDAGPYISPSPSCSVGEPGSGANLELFIPSVDTKPSRPLSEITHPWLNPMLRVLYDPEKSDLLLSYMNKRLKGVELNEVLLLGAIENARHKTGDLIIISNMEPREEILRSPGLTEAFCTNDYGQLITMGPDGEKIHHIGKGRRKIYVLNPFPLSHEDFLTLVANNTSSIMGCSGDQTLAELMVFNRALPFYQIRSHKKVFFNQMIALAGEVLGGKHPYVAYLQTLKLFNIPDTPTRDLFWLRYEMLKLLKDPELKKGAALFHSYLIQNRNLSRNLLSYLEKNVK